MAVEVSAVKSRTVAGQTVAQSDLNNSNNITGPELPVTVSELPTEKISHRNQDGHHTASLIISQPV